MSENIIIQESGTPKAMAIDKLQLKKIDGGSEKWVPEAGEANSLIKMDIGKNAEIEATDYNANAITEVNVTREIADIEIQPDTVREGSDPHIVSIKEGGKSRFISGVEKLRVNLQSGGTTDFAPKESAVTGELHATELGRYIAKKDGYIGYSLVTVDLSGDSWGDLPDEIRITTPPTKEVQSWGDTVDYTGMVVTAFKNGRIWQSDQYPNGIIPINELDISPSVVDENTDIFVNGIGIEPWTTPVRIGHGGAYILDVLQVGKYGWYDQIRLTWQIPSSALVTTVWAPYGDVAIGDLYIAGREYGGTIVDTLEYYKEGILVKTETGNHTIGNSGTFINKQNNEQYYGGGYEAYTLYKKNGGQKFVTIGGGYNPAGSIVNFSGDNIIIETNLPGYLANMYTEGKRVEISQSYIKSTRIFRGLFYENAGFNAAIQWQRPRDKAVLKTSTFISVNIGVEDE